jgi:deoxycytidylate deaminase
MLRCRTLMRFLSGHEEEQAMQWMAVAAEVAVHALCLRDKCGTVIVNIGEMIGSGYNSPPLDDENNRTCLNEYPLSPAKPKFDRTCCMHAEWRAIFDALRNNPSKVLGSTLYFMRLDEAGEMTRAGKIYCTVCSRLTLDSGIREFVLWHEEGLCAYSAHEFNQRSYAFHRVSQ